MNENSPGGVVPPTPKPPPRRRRYRKILWALAFCFMALFVLLAALPSLLSTSSAREAVVGRLGDALGAPVSVGALRLGWSGQQRIDDLRIGSPEGSSVDEDLLSVRSVTVEQGLLDLALPGELVATVEIEAPILRVRRDKEGRFSFEGLGGADSAGTETPPPPEESPETQPSEGLPEMPGKVTLALRGGELHFRDDLLGTASRVSDCDLDIHLGREKVTLALRALAGHPDGQDPGRLELDATVDGFTGGRSTEDLVVSAEGRAERLDLRPYAAVIEELTGGATVGEQTRLTLTELTVKGPLGAGDTAMRSLNAHGLVELTGDVAYRGVKVDKLTGRLRLSDGEASVTDLLVTVNGGEVKSDLIRMSLVDEKPPFECRLEMNDVGLRGEMAPVLSMILPLIGPETTDLAGKLTAGFTIDGKGFALADLKESLKGSGSLSLAEGRLAGSPLLRELGSLLKTPLEELLFEKLATEFKIDAGKINSSRVVVQPRESKIRDMELSGSTSFDQEVDYGVSLSVLEDAIGDRKMREVLALARSTLGKEGLPLRLKGSLTSPKLVLDSERLPALGDALKGAAADLIRANVKEDQVPGLEGRLEKSASGLGDVLKQSGLGGVLGGTRRSSEDSGTRDKAPEAPDRSQKKD